MDIGSQVASGFVEPPYAGCVRRDGTTAHNGDWDVELLKTSYAQRDEIKKLRKTVALMLDALIWASGADDFAQEGKAHLGWEALGRPAIAAGFAVCPKGSAEV